MDQYIDVTPTWTAMVPTFLLILTNGNADGRKTVEGELLRMARLADEFVKLQKVKS